MYLSLLRWRPLCQSPRSGHWSAEWLTMWLVVGLLSLLRIMCACGEMFAGVCVIPHLLRNRFRNSRRKCLLMMTALQEEHLSKKRTVRLGRAKGGRRLIASSCNARCVVINGNIDNRLGKETCKGPGAEHVALLSGGGLFPVWGERNHRSLPASVLPYVLLSRPYIQDRDSARRQLWGCFRNGISLFLSGIPTGRRHVRIGEALISSPEPVRSHTLDDIPPFHTNESAHNASNSRRPSRDSLIPGGPCQSSLSESFPSLSRFLSISISRAISFSLSPYMRRRLIAEYLHLPFGPMSYRLRNMNVRCLCALPHPAGWVAERTRLELQHRN